MNERIKELAEQAEIFKDFAVTGMWLADDKELERFVELVRQDYLEDISGHTLKIVVEAVAKEREACAALCDDWFAATAGAAIRARKESA